MPCRCCELRELQLGVDVGPRRELRACCQRTGAVCLPHGCTHAATLAHHHCSAPACPPCRALPMPCASTCGCLMRRAATAWRTSSSCRVRTGESIFAACGCHGKPRGIGDTAADCSPGVACKLCWDVNAMDRRGVLLTYTSASSCSLPTE